MRFAKYSSEAIDREPSSGTKAIRRTKIAPAESWRMKKVSNENGNHLLVNLKVTGIDFNGTLILFGQIAADLTQFIAFR